MDAPLRQPWLRDLHWLLASEPLVGDGLDDEAVLLVGRAGCAPAWSSACPG